jgi:hypothetical protein
MLIPYCNMCEEKCSLPATTRHFTDIGKLLGGHSAGLEVIPLTNGEVSPETHICDECLTELMSAALGDTDPALKQKTLDERESQLNNSEAALTERQAKLKKDFAELKAKEQKLIGHNQEFIGELAKRDERIKVLEAQVANLQASSAKVWKQATAQALQVDVPMAKQRGAT